MEYAKKALDLAIQIDKINEFVNQIEYFIESVKSELSNQQENMHIGDPLRVRHKGRQPNRYKSCGEPQKKKVRRIQDITNTTTNKNRKEDVMASQEEKKKRCYKNCNQSSWTLYSKMSEYLKV
ncbi:hypothetical protein C1646_676310 [Rhizophagus diaphanus]|nr:hypothetical protein C1646_676310 [Rhizophagus diaphanus] [Rhizophagus sp. MUCL 43196]